MICRNCGAGVDNVILDLGTAPPSNHYLTRESLNRPEVWFPLKVHLCEGCWLVQTEDFLAREEIFRSDYAYFSSTSTSWLAHAEEYVRGVADRFLLNENSLVVEVAANDGYLLQYVAARGIPCLGIEPTSAAATVGRARGIDYEELFLGRDTAQTIVTNRGLADLVVANNVVAHVPDLDDFLLGLRALLKPTGVLTIEFPLVTNLIRGSQFDTVYHEHYSYFSLSSLLDSCGRRGLRIFDLEHLSTHGGSLRVYIQRVDSGSRTVSPQVTAALADETRQGVRRRGYYSRIQDHAVQAKTALLNLLLDAKKEGVKVAAYGAAAKGNTLLNFAGIRPDLIPFVVDLSPSKQGKFLPGSRIPILGVEALYEHRPGLVIVFPWNLKDEIREQLRFVTSWGANLYTVVPHVAKV